MHLKLISNTFRISSVKHQNDFERRKNKIWTKIGFVRRRNKNLFGFEYSWILFNYFSVQKDTFIASIFFFGFWWVKWIWVWHFCCSSLILVFVKKKEKQIKMKNFLTEILCSDWFLNWTEKPKKRKLKAVGFFDLAKPKVYFDTLNKRK